MSSNSDKIPYMRVREIASESHTSASSVMRFIRKLGYESFSEFKRYFKNSEDKASLKHAFEMPVLKEEDFTRDLGGDGAYGGISQDFLNISPSDD